MIEPSEPSAPVVIYGSGGHAQELAEVVRAMQREGRGPSFAGFLDDEIAHHGRRIHGAEVLGGMEWLNRHREHQVVLGVGSPRLKQALADRLQTIGARFGILVHPRAEVSPFVTLEPGVVITAGCVLTTQIHLEAHVHVNRLCTVGHDCKVGAFTHLAPGSILSGNVTIERGCELGTGVRVIPGVRIGAWTIVGAGACVIEDLPSRVTAVGVPARITSHHAEVATDDDVGR